MFACGEKVCPGGVLLKLMYTCLCVKGVCVIFSTCGRPSSLLSNGHLLDVFIPAYSYFSAANKMFFFVADSLT